MSDKIDSKEDRPSNDDKDEVEEESPPQEGSSSSLRRDSKDDSAVEMIRRYMAEKLGFLDKKQSSEKKKKVLESVSIDSIVKYMLSESCTKIVVMAGAGISTSAGIPDFRSAGSGLYHNLAEYNLPHPQAIFEMDYFRAHPEPFFALAKQLIPGTYRPTRTHKFIRLLHDKGLLLRHYTQNIDGLEKAAGVPPDKVVEAHGTFYSSHCLSCKKEYLLDWLRERLKTCAVPRCDDCDGLVKPDVILFGEPLPERFFRLVESDFPQATLLIIMGSSLVVQPFASLVDRVESHVPRLLINREKAGQRDRIMSLLGMAGGLDLDSEKNVRDVGLIGDCDEMVNQLAEKLGWSDDLERLVDEEEPTDLTAAQFLQQS